MNNHKTNIISLLEQMNYEYIYTIQYFENVILKNNLHAALKLINPNLNKSIIDSAIKKLESADHYNLLNDNRNFHKTLLDGLVITTKGQDSNDQHVVNLIDYNNVLNNSYIVSEKFSNNQIPGKDQPDIIIYINGLPLVIILTSSFKNNCDSINAIYEKLEVYKTILPNLLTYNSLCILSNNNQALVGTVSSSLMEFNPWLLSKTSNNNLSSSLKELIKTILSPAAIVDLIRHFIFFTHKPNSSIINKKLASYHQYFAVNRSIDSTIRAIGYYPNTGKSSTYIVAESPSKYGLKDTSDQEYSDHRAGIVYHVPKHSKYLTMALYTGKMISELNNLTCLIIIDRNYNFKQLFETFELTASLLLQKPLFSHNIIELTTLIYYSNNDIIFNTIQDFQNSNIKSLVSNRKNILVIVDDIHPTQINSLKNLKIALPNATYIKFNSLSTDQKELDITDIFGNHIDVYGL